MRNIDVTLQFLDDSFAGFNLPTLNGVYDIEIDWDGDIKTADTFDTYIIVALLTDARADESEVLVAHKRRGWIGNEYTPGFQMGSKLWLYEQSRLTRTVMNDVNGEVLRALQSLVDDELAIAIRGAELRLTNEGVYLEVEIQRTLSETEKRYFELWQNTGVS